MKTKWNRRILFTGNMDPNDPCYPPPDPTGGWSPELPEPFRSAYLEGGEAEPDFTNYAKVLQRVATRCPPPHTISDFIVLFLK